MEKYFIFYIESRTADMQKFDALIKLEHPDNYQGFPTFEKAKESLENLTISGEFTILPIIKKN